MSAATFDGGAERRRGMRVTVAISLAAHAAVVAWFGFGPSFRRDPIIGTQIVTVELVAAAPAQAPRPQARPAPPPKPSPRKVVLPTRPQRAAAPAPVVKPEPKPKPEEQDYEDLLKELRADRGESRPERFETPPPPPTPTYEPAANPTPIVAAAVAPQAGGQGRLAPPEVVAWVRDARIHVRRGWVLEDGFRFESLETHVEVDLGADGRVRGEPRITQRSGNPWYDKSVVRAIQKADPLPAPPEAGKWPFVFRPEDY